MQLNGALWPELAMEHRWGTRIAVHIPVRVTAAHLSMASIGRITNLSLSGGFITGFGFRPLSRIHINFDHPLLQRPVLKLAAFVARVCDQGAGIVWCDFAPRPVAELLFTITSPKDAERATPHWRRRPAINPIVD
jgi:hypothetical protein